MTDRHYTDEYGDAIIVEEFESLKECKEMIKMCFTENVDYIGQDDYLFILYKDGTYTTHEALLDGQRIKLTNIKAVIIDNSMTYQIFGDYYMDENIIPQVE